MRPSGELKVRDVDYASYTADTTGQVQLLNGIASGADYTERIGRKIRMKSLFVRGICQQGDATGVLINLARMIIVYDKQTNGSAPVISDILKESNSASQLNLENRDRFVVLADMTNYTGALVTTATQTYTGQQAHVVERYIKLNHEVVFGGTTNNVGDVATGGLFAVFIGNRAAGDASAYLVSFRLRFVDN